MRRAIGLVFLVAIGCSEQEELKPDPGVSPFYPSPSSDEAKAAVPAVAPTVTTTDRPAADRNTPLRPDEVEKQLRIALRAAERGDLDRARTLLDQILAIEPIHREALTGRASVAMEESKKAATPEERLAEVEKAGELLRTLRRAYERPNKREVGLIALVNYEEVHVNTLQGRLDRALEIVEEVHKAGFDPFDTIDRDPDLAKLRDMPGYHALIKSIDEERLAKAKARLKDELARTPDFRFDFDVKTLDGQQLSLEKLRGKVVLIDIWGTWCQPCREAIPGLMQLYQKHRRRGFEIIGLDFEQTPRRGDGREVRQAIRRGVEDPLPDRHGGRGPARQDPRLPGVSHHLAHRSDGEGPV